MFSTEEIADIVNNLPQRLILEVFNFHRSMPLGKETFDKLSQYSFEGGFYRFFSDYHGADPIWQALIIRDFGKPAWEMSQRHSEFSLKECYLRHARISIVEKFLELFILLNRPYIEHRVIELALFWNKQTFEGKFQAANQSYLKCMSLLKLFDKLSDNDYTAPVLLLLPSASEQLLICFISLGINLNRVITVYWERCNLSHREKMPGHYGKRDTVTYTDETLLTFAIKEGRLELIKLLHHLGADMNLPVEGKHWDNKVNAPIIIARRTCKMEVLQTVLDCGATVTDDAYIKDHEQAKFIAAYFNDWAADRDSFNAAFLYQQLLSSPPAASKTLTLQNRKLLFNHLQWLVKRATGKQEKIEIMEKAIQLDANGKPAHALSKSLHKRLTVLEYIPFVKAGVVSKTKAELTKLGQPQRYFYHSTAFKVGLSCVAIAGVGLSLMLLPNLITMVALSASTIAAITVPPIALLLMFTGYRLRSARKVASEAMLNHNAVKTKPRFIDTIFDEKPGSPDVLPLYRGKVDITREQEPASQSTDLVLRF